MAFLSKSRKERPNWSTNNEDMVVKAKCFVVREWVFLYRLPNYREDELLKTKTYAWYESKILQINKMITVKKYNNMFSGVR